MKHSNFNRKKYLKLDNIEVKENVTPQEQVELIEETVNEYTNDFQPSENGFVEETEFETPVEIENEIWDYIEVDDSTEAQNTPDDCDLINLESGKTIKAYVRKTGLLNVHYVLCCEGCTEKRKIHKGKVKSVVFHDPETAYEDKYRHRENHNATSIGFILGGLTAMIVGFVMFAVGIFGFIVYALTGWWVLFAFMPIGFIVGVIGLIFLITGVVMKSAGKRKPNRGIAE